MPSFTFTSPEGKRYKVNGPEGATKEQAFAVLQQQIAGGAAQAAPNPQMAGVPGYDAQGLPQAASAPAKPADPSLVDRIIGGGETALALATGATTGLAGMVGGGLVGLGKSVADGAFGTQKGVQTIENAAGQGMEKYTYAPRTQQGQEQTQAWGEALNSALPLTPLTAEMGALGQGAKAAAQGARDLAPAAREAGATAAKRVAASNAAINAADDALAAQPSAKLRDLVKKPQSTMSGVGAAAASKEAVKLERFDRLGIKPTLGQITRDPQQLKFEIETAKTEEGKAIVDHRAEQNAQIQRNFEGLADAYEPNASDLRDIGQSVIEPIIAKAKAEKAAARALYDEADAAGEMAEPVDVTNLVTFIKANKGKDKIAPIISMIESELGQNATVIGGGLDKLTLTPTPKRYAMSLRASEDLRQAINDGMEMGTPGMVWGNKAMKLIDSATEGKGGARYQQARRAWENYKSQFDDHAVIGKLLQNKPGTRDPFVVPEDVFRHTILNPRGKDDIRHVFRVLEAHPAGMDPAIVAAGRQAAANLRGALVNHIREQMFSNGGANVLGDVVGSQKKMRSLVDSLDARGKLKAVLGAEGADYVRDLRDAAVDIYTLPEGVNNTSNNLGGFVAAMDKLAHASKPIPGVKTVAHGAADIARSRAIAKRVEQALNPKKTPNGSPFNSSQRRPPTATVH